MAARLGECITMLFQQCCRNNRRLCWTLGTVLLISVCCMQLFAVYKVQFFLFFFLYYNCNYIHNCKEALGVLLFCAIRLLNYKADAVKICLPTWHSLLIFVWEAVPRTARRQFYIVHRCGFIHCVFSYFRKEIQQINWQRKSEQVSCANVDPSKFFIILCLLL